LMMCETTWSFSFTPYLFGIAAQVKHANWPRGRK
jgi:hypothetical protein